MRLCPAVWVAVVLIAAVARAQPGCETGYHDPTPENVLEHQKEISDKIYRIRKGALLVGKNCATDSALFGLLDRLEIASIKLREHLFGIIGSSAALQDKEEAAEFYKNIISMDDTLSSLALKLLADMGTGE